ncbi:MAG: serine--tRNA ligase [Candidatus Abyssobacteria bacterium SURF_17]|uniref:Serine--tRNA ligase n=1 Tax=Candidatus Abyssobacteria bacterium SURF_17 TaxID=2093361 RepID=A0A419EXP9_9BACT|nr:MAG: serine--tRNA ligase [Candidatus Abyssubacteria bacterium SURF_17]
MIDVKLLRENPDVVRAALDARGSAFDLGPLLALEEERRKLVFAADELKREKNAVSERIAELKKARRDAEALIEEMRAVGERIRTLDAEINDKEERIRAQWLAIPNIPHSSVPYGKSEADNVEIRTWGTPPTYDFEPLSHADLGEKLGILDFERAAKITGARFTLSFGAGAMLERALMNFMLDLHTTKHGYTEVLPPFMVNIDSMVGTGQFPKFAGDYFMCQPDQYVLVPTAEVPVTNIFRNEILAESSLPIRFAAYTPCFRREAGSYGKDTRGMIRVHQFNKVELVKFCRPEVSYEEHEKLTRDAEEVLQLLEIPYRVVALCTADLGDAAAKCYDIEAWVPSQGTYREISSCSNFEDYQARRANIRYRPKGGKPRFLHTLNGSGLAIGRTVVAILENFQQADGTVVIPQNLRPFMGGMERIIPREKP